MKLCVRVCVHVCVCVRARVHALTDGYQTIIQMAAAAERQTLWQERKESCVVRRRSVTARPLSGFVLFHSFSPSFFESFRGRVGGGPPGASGGRGFIP